MTSTAPKPPTAPPFRAESSRGQTLELDSFAGKVPIVLFRVGPLADEAAQGLIAELDRREVDFGHLRVQLLGVIPTSARELRAYADEHGVDATLVADPEETISTDYGLDDDQHRAVVVDRALGVTPLVGGPADPREFADWLLRAVGELGLTDDPEPLTQ